MRSELTVDPGPVGDGEAGFQATLRTVFGGGRAKVLVAPAVAAVVVAGVVASPALTIAAAFAGLGLAWLVAAPDRPRRVFIASVAALLVGYAFLGRGLAHAGVPPLYVGELVLGLGVVALAVVRPRIRLDAPRVLLLAFMGWGLLQTVPYVGRYGLDALRDSVTWSYAVLAILIVALVNDRDLLAGVARYRKFAFPLCLFVLLTLPINVDALPGLPGSDLPALGAKPGDTAVHMAGIAAFILVGLYAAAPTRVPEMLVWLVWLPTSALMGVVSRGGLGAIVMSGLAVLFGRAPARLMTPLFIGVLLVVALLHIDPVVDLGLNRTVSIGQVMDNVTSVFSESENSALEGTKAYRLRWWGKIIDYTVDGPYFWTGKGFGVNLADDDGFQLFEDHSLRAPHNGHVEILARAGVPGLALWIAFNLVWAASVLAAIRRARAIGATTWAAVLIWLLVYWAAMLVNASFDPYLQGPQGGIWYWAIIGAGLVVVDIVRRKQNGDDLEEPPIRQHVPEPLRART